MSGDGNTFRGWESPRLRRKAKKCLSRLGWRGVGDHGGGPRCETGRMKSNQGWSRSGDHEQNLSLIRPDIQTSHDDTILLSTAPSVRILTIRAPLQHRPRSTGLNDRGIRVCFEPLRRALIAFLGSAFEPRHRPAE